MLGALRGGQLLSRSAIRAASSIVCTSRTAPLVPRQKFIVRSAFRPSSAWTRQQAAAASEETPEDVVELTRFQDLADHGLVSPRVIDVLTQRMNIQTMTDVQRLTINETLDGADV